MTKLKQMSHIQPLPDRLMNQDGSLFTAGTWAGAPRAVPIAGLLFFNSELSETGLQLFQSKKDHPKGWSRGGGGA